MAASTVLSPGSRFTRYTTEAVVGRGGMSIVYAARDLELDRQVALKVMALSGRGDDRFRERFLRESRLAASIDHPNVIPIYDAGEAEGCLYIAMRLVPGTDLRLLLRREGTLAPARAVAIVAQAASAIEAAHARGLLHRDVKPANILLASDDGTTEHVYLSDFGVAVPGGENPLERGFHGTAEYAAPEQVQGRPEPRSDVYALACVLFECLTGDPPFGRGRLFETLWRHLNDEPPSISARLPDCPSALDYVFAAALAKDPSQRPATCTEFVADVRATLGLDRPRARLRVIAAVGLVAIGAALAFGLVLRDQFRSNGGASTAAGVGTIHTLAGTGDPGSTGDGGPAARAQVGSPFSVAVDPAGNVYVSEGLAGRIRRIDPRGRISTVAPRGTAVVGVLEFRMIGNLGIDPAGRLNILRVDLPMLMRLDAPGRLTTLAGTGNYGYLADSLRTVSPDLCGHPSGPAFDRAGRVYIACLTANRVIRVDGKGRYTTIAGNGSAGYSGDGGPATKAELNRPTDVAIDSRGNLYIADYLNNVVRKVTPDGIITTFAGTGRPGFSADGWLASTVDLFEPDAVAVDRAGNVYIVEEATFRVRKVTPDGRITTVAGSGRPGSAGDGGPANRAELQDPTDVAVDRHGNIYIADQGANRVRKVVVP
jgi:streptogramin lyase